MGLPCFWFCFLFASNAKQHYHVSIVCLCVWQACDSCFLKATVHFNVTYSNCGFNRHRGLCRALWQILYIYFFTYLFIFDRASQYISVCGSCDADFVIASVLNRMCMRGLPQSKAFFFSCCPAVNASETRTNTLYSFVVILKWCNESGWRQGPGAMTALCWLGCARDALKRGYCHETDWKCHFPL